MSRSRIIIAALLVASAVVFAIGVSVERSQGESHSDAPATSQLLGKATLAPEGSAAREGAEKTAAISKSAATSAPEGSAAREAAEKKPSTTAAKAVATSAPEGSAAREAAEGRGESATASGETTEKLFGIETESTGLVIAVVVLSLMLAAGLLVIRSPLILVGAAVVVLGATAFDIRELAHQIDESRNGVAVLAALTAVSHLAVAAVAAGLLLIERRKRA